MNNLITTDKKLWTVAYRGEGSTPESIEVIASSYELLNRWILRHTWCNTVTHVMMKQTIQEIEEIN